VNPEAADLPVALRPAPSALRLRRASTALTVWTLLSTDLLTASAVSALTVTVKLQLDPQLPLVLYLGLWPALLALVAGYAALGLYPGIGIGPAERLRRTTVATTLFFVGLAGATFLLRGAEIYSRAIFLVSWALCLVVVPVMRAAVEAACRRHRWWGIPVVVIGGGRTGRRAIEELLRKPDIGLRPVAVLDDDPTIGGDLAGVPVVGRLQDSLTARAHGARHAIIAMPGLSPEQLAAVIDRQGQVFRRLYVVPVLPGAPLLWATTRDFGGALALEVQRNLLRPQARVAKRALDLAMCLIGSLVATPVVLAICALIRLTSPGPALYSQQRIGQGGHAIRVWKFRTMVRDADTVLANHLAAHPDLRAEWEASHKLRDDPRITAIGAWLRRTSLDELPQVWNVLRGDMSLVGPRPIITAEIPKYREQYAYYLRVHPGITGLWQVSGRSDTTYDERVQFDTYYVQNWSVWLDLVILARTVLVVLFGKGAY